MIMVLLLLVINDRVHAGTISYDNLGNPMVRVIEHRMLKTERGGVIRSIGSGSFRNSKVELENMIILLLLILLLRDSLVVP